MIKVNDIKKSKTNNKTAITDIYYRTTKGCVSQVFVVAVKRGVGYNDKLETWKLAIALLT